jgi:hypothetical protein
MYKVKVPEGKKGDAAVERFTLTPERAKRENLYAQIEAAREKHVFRPVFAGEWTRLCIDGKVMMSDTPAEQEDHATFTENAEGRVLITGLGLGMVIDMMFRRKPRKVEHVTVIESNPNVAALVWPHYVMKYGGRRLTLVEYDAKKWLPEVGTMFDCAWHDIWPAIDSDNWEDMKDMRRHYAPYCKRQGFWCENIVRKLHREVEADARETRAFRIACGLEVPALAGSTEGFKT